MRLVVGWYKRKWLIMKKLLFLIILGGVVYLLWGNINVKAVKDKAQETEKTLIEKGKKLQGEVSK